MSKIKMDIKRFTIKDSKVLNVEDISLYDVKQDEDYFDCIKETGYVFYEGNSQDILIDINYRERVGMFLNLIYNEYLSKLHEYVA